jgi:hypothetical protein
VGRLKVWKDAFLGVVGLEIEYSGLVKQCHGLNNEGLTHFNIKSPKRENSEFMVLGSE